jgi:hypothetical protein
VLVKGDTLPVFLDPSLRLSGWSGGQGLQWAVPLAEGELTVKSSTGFASGFMLWGSSETGDQHTTLTQSQIYYRVGTMCLGGWFIDTTTFERYTYASRQAGPLVPIVYQPEMPLRFSLAGKWTPEDEWTLSGDPRGSNSNVYGYVTRAPSSWSDGYLGIQTFL